MSHKRHHKQPPTAAPTLPIVYGSFKVPGYVSAREQLRFFAIVLMITAAAAVIAIFFAGYSAGVASVAHG